MEEKFALKQGEGNGIRIFYLIKLLIAETDPSKTILQLVYFSGVKIYKKMPTILLSGKSECG